MPPTSRSCWAGRRRLAAVRVQTTMLEKFAGASLHVTLEHLGTTGAAVIPTKADGDGLRWTIIGLLSLGIIVAYLSRSNLSVALAMPDVLRSFHLSDTDRGALNSAFFWAYAALQIPAGWVVDRYGVKW